MAASALADAGLVTAVDYLKSQVSLRVEDLKLDS